MANTTDTKGDTLPDLDDLLQCPVCYEIPTGQIFQCNEGHHVCGRCKARLDQCPVCRALFFGTRNYAMEELIANVRKLQAFKLGGKMTVTSRSGASESTVSLDSSVDYDNSNEANEEDNQVASMQPPPPASKGLFRCLCCKFVETVRLPAARLLNHLRYYHAADLIEGRSENGEYVQVWQFVPEPFNRIVIPVRVADMGVFFLVIEVERRTICAWVSMAASPSVSLEFYYTITLSGRDREAIFTDMTWSVRSCEGYLKKTGRCLTVSGEDAQALRTTGTMSGRLVLRRVPLELLAPRPEPRAVLRVARRGTEQAASDQPVLLASQSETRETLARIEAERARITEESRPSPPVPPPNAQDHRPRNDRQRMPRVPMPRVEQEESRPAPPVPPPNVQERGQNHRSRNGRQRTPRVTAPPSEARTEESRPAPPVPPPAPTNREEPERNHLSRSARRTLRQRLLAALDSAADRPQVNGALPPPPVPPPTTAPPQSSTSSNNQSQRSRKKRRQRR